MNTPSFGKFSPRWLAGKRGLIVTLLAGLALMLALFFANSFFIWDFEVSGSETVPAEKILRVLEKQGLRRGSFAYSLRPQDICNRALPELPGEE